MQKNIFNTKNYWRNIDKQILSCFLVLFILGVFISFSSTSFLADERLNKSYYFFFQKHLIYACVSFLVMIFISTLSKNVINKSLIPIFIFFIIIIISSFFWNRGQRSQKMVKFIYFSFSTYRIC